MGRSVSVASGAVHVAYQTFEAEDEDCAADDFQFFMNELQGSLQAAFPSVSDDDRWLDREDHVIASNQFANFGVSEYCGLVSIWVVPKDNDYASGGWYSLRDRWIDQIEKRFFKTVSGAFGTDLNKQGTFSNGEAIFQAADAKPRGELGLGFSSKEGWL